MVEATYYSSYDSGAGAFLISPWSVLLKNVIGGVALYEGRENGRHKIRSLEAGTNVTLTLVESEDSGDYRVRIAAAAGGGGGGGGSPHENVGSGAQVHKTNDGTYDELRTLTAGLGMTLTQNTDEIEVKLANIAAWTIWLRNDGTTGAPAATTILALTEESNPAVEDYLFLGKNADGAFRKVQISKIKGTGSTIVASGMVNYSTGAASTTVNSQTCTGGTLAQKPGDPTRLRFTFTATLSSANYVVHVEVDPTGSLSGPRSFLSERTTTYFDIFLDAGYSYTSNLRFSVIKID